MNFDQICGKLSTGCLLYVVNARTGELRPMTQDEYLFNQRREHCLIPHVDVNAANARSLIILAAIRRWEREAS